MTDQTIHLGRPGRLPGPLTRLRTRARARTDQPAWARPALLAVLALAAILCLWHLTISGTSNEYYAAAAKSASVSWKAWFFGSLDPGSFITVDKPPLALWVMGLSARVFGFSSFSILLPQALETIAAVAILNATVRRAFGPAAGIAAALALALTPVTVAIARVNNPDALLVLLLVAAGWCTVRAIESGATKHLAWAGALVGLAFMTKMLQGWMIAPALAAAYLIAGPQRIGARVRQLALAALAMVAASAAWPVAVSLWPGSKPYIGGSTDGSVWDLILGYNGFGRLTGEGAVGGASFGGAAGLWRMFNEQVGGQVAWLLPLAAVGLVAGLWATRRAPRTDRARAAWILFGVWALVHVAVFSLQRGIFHPYYVSALAPAVAALAGAGAVTLWRWARASWVGHAALVATLGGSTVLAVELLGRTPDFAPALRVAIPVAAALAIVASVALRLGGGATRRMLAVAGVAGAIALLAGPASYSVANLGRSLNGNNVIAGPTSIASSAARAGQGGGQAPSAARGGSGSQPMRASSTARSSSVGAQGGQGGGLSQSAIAYLLEHQGSAKYLVAASGSQTTSAIIVATGKPVVTIGGFSGNDNAPTVSQLGQMVADGELRYVLVGSAGAGPGGTSSALTAWAKAHGKAVSGVTVSGGTLYRVSA
jgi:4-amino-4-deoxy-L-arabinose transferase-like glycosyltransferase